jgi:hypothetical protein
MLVYSLPTYLVLYIVLEVTIKFYLADFQHNNEHNV